MKFLDKVLVKDDFYDNVLGTVLEYKYSFERSAVSDRNARMYKILFNGTTHSDWIPESKLTNLGLEE
jgi:hypothetical protein